MKITVKSVLYTQLFPYPADRFDIHPQVGGNVFERQAVDECRELLHEKLVAVFGALAAKHIEPLLGHGAIVLRPYPPDKVELNVLTVDTL